MLLRKRHDGSLIVADKAADEAVSKLSVGECVAVTKRDLRSYGNLKRWQQFCKDTFEFQERYELLRHWKNYILVGVGHCDYWVAADGATHILPLSVDYATVKQEEKFRRIFEDAVKYVFQCPYITWTKEMEDHINGY